MNNTRSDQCGKGTGLELLGPSTYEYFGKSSNNLRVSNLHKLLRGELPSNYHEHKDYLSEKHWSDREPAFAAAFRWIHQGNKLAEFDGWKEEDWLYGKKILENCPWGYNCRTQTHNVYHALRLNHLCEPTKSA
ncbi:hypothetical protein K435DRAFT_792063 [Dendrothele bispora CBS 962.96]|uniref:Uncharacterized protein n=1 Tax=Dendrothele bispora (strain CBS 962.96) TaxID=1314807 RepID=A0A4S8MJM1_DENBC|nr:hypothetical protein K435DRAFT_792063 [Dendrothele bispora CBS 962.96]